MGSRPRHTIGIDPEFEPDGLWAIASDRLQTDNLAFGAASWIRQRRWPEMSRFS